jgi:hypothetical protein
MSAAAASCRPAAAAAAAAAAGDEEPAAPDYDCLRLVKWLFQQVSGVARNAHWQQSSAVLFSLLHVPATGQQLCDTASS